MAKIDYSNINAIAFTQNIGLVSGPQVMAAHYVSNMGNPSALAFAVEDLRRVLGKENIGKLREQVKVLKVQINPDLTEFSHAVLVDQIVRLEAQIQILMLVFVISKEEL